MTILKNKGLLGLFLVSTLAFSCKKAETKSETENTKTPNNEVSQVQEAQPLQNAEGEKIDVVYFAEGDKVAVRIKMPNGEECKLSAKGVTENGNPIFTDGKCIWEMHDDGHSGKLTDETGETKEYQ